MLRTIFAGLKGSFNFQKSVIDHIACIDEVDREILRFLYEAGSPGLLPKDLQARLEQFKFTRHQISRRILRMNKRLEKELGALTAEKRGWHWALTSFAVNAWGGLKRKSGSCQELVSLRLVFPIFIINSFLSFFIWALERVSWYIIGSVCVFIIL